MTLNENSEPPVRADAQPFRAHVSAETLVTLTIFFDSAAARKREETITVETLADRIRKATAKEKDRLPWVKLATFGDKRSTKSSLRNDENVLTITGVEADYDGGEVEMEFARRKLEQQGLASILYTSPSHTEAAPRWRVLCPTSGLMTPDRRSPLLARLNGLLGGIVSGESWTLGQSYYFGSVNRNPAHEVAVIEGEPIDLHDDLDAIARWKTAKASSTDRAENRFQCEADGTSALVQDLLAGIDYHGSLTRLAWRYLGGGMLPGAVVQTLRGLMEAVPIATRDRKGSTITPGRWQSRFDEVPKLVRSAQEKQGRKAAEDGSSTSPDADAALSDPARDGSSDGANEEVIPGIGPALAAETWAALDTSPETRLLGSLVTQSSKIFLVGSTGLGKTLLAYAMAAGMASGRGFLDLTCDRPSRWLIIDGEMPRALIKQRVVDMMHRSGGIPPGSISIYASDWADEFAKQFPTFGVMEPLNTEAGQNFVLHLAKAIGGIDGIIFDNVMSLVAGDQKDEVPWSETLSLVARITSAGMSQIWLDHTGHNRDRQYGSATKAWRFDAVGIMKAVEGEAAAGKGEVAFTLTFDHPGKARRRTPDNWRDFETRTIRLSNDEWTMTNAEGAKGGEYGKVAKSRKVFYDALSPAISTSTRTGETTLVAWEHECVRRGLIEPEPGGGSKETWQQRDARRSAFRRAKSDLLTAGWVAIKDDRVIDLKTPWQ